MRIQLIAALGLLLTVSACGSGEERPDLCAALEGRAEADIRTALEPKLAEVRGLDLKAQIDALFAHFREQSCVAETTGGGYFHTEPPGSEIRVNLRNASAGDEALRLDFAHLADGSVQFTRLH